MMDQNQICDNLKKDDHADYEMFATNNKSGNNLFGEHKINN